MFFFVFDAFTQKFTRSRKFTTSKKEASLKWQNSYLKMKEGWQINGLRLISLATDPIILQPRALLGWFNLCCFFILFYFICFCFFFCVVWSYNRYCFFFLANSQSHRGKRLWCKHNQKNTTQKIGQLKTLN